MANIAFVFLLFFFNFQTIAAEGFASIPNYGKIATVFHPALVNGGKAAPTIILLGGSEGGIWPAETAEVSGLRQGGYNVLTAAYFGAEGVPAELSRIRIESFGEAITQLKKNPLVNARCIGVMGVSKGGELTLVLASLYPDLHLAVAIVPADVVFQSSEATTASHASWTYQDKELPFVPYKLWSGAGLSAFFSAVTGMGEDYLPLHQQALDNNPERVKAAAIAVEKINGPVLLVSGTKDQYWPSSMMAERANSRLGTSNFAYAHAHYSYNSDHYVLGHAGLPTQKAAPRLSPWPAIQAFVDENLGTKDSCRVMP